MKLDDLKGKRYILIDVVYNNKYITICYDRGSSILELYESDVIYNLGKKIKWCKIEENDVLMIFKKYKLKESYNYLGSSCIVYRCDDDKLYIDISEVLDERE